MFERYITHSLALIILPIISGLWLVIGVSIIGAHTTGYSHVSQFMSELGATGAPLAPWTNYSVFMPTEILILGFFVILNKYLHGSIIERLSMLGLCLYAGLLILAAIIPCDLACHSDKILTNSAFHIAHMVFATMAYPLALTSLFSLGLTVMKTSFFGRCAIPSAIIGFCFYFAIAAIPEAQGLFQRLLETWIYIHFVSLGYCVGR